MAQNDLMFHQETPKKEDGVKFEGGGKMEDGLNAVTCPEQPTGSEQCMSVAARERVHFWEERDTGFEQFSVLLNSLVLSFLHGKRLMCPKKGMSPQGYLSSQYVSSNACTFSK